MSVEDQIRTALHDEADGAYATPEKWQAVRSAARKRRQRRRTAGYGLTGAAAIAIILGLVVVAVSLRDESTIASGGVPEEIVAIVDGKVVVLSSADGEAVRTLVRRKDAKGLGSVAVSGTTVYFTRKDLSSSCAEGENAGEIATIPIEGGSIKRIASGGAPVVSPDGRYIAYAEKAAGNACGLFDALVIRDLATRTRLPRDVSVPLEKGVRSVFPLSWAPDGSRLLYGVTPAYTDGFPISTELREFVLDTGQARSLTITDPNGETTVLRGRLPATYFGSANEITRVVPRRVSQVESLDLTSGETRTLFEVPGYVVHSSAAARHLLVVVEEGGGPTGIVWRLYRWSPKEKPVRIASKVVDAVWVPNNGE